MKTADLIDQHLTDVPPAVGAPDPTPFGATCDAGPVCAAPQDDDPLAYWCTLAEGHGGNWHIAGDGEEVCAVWGTLL